MERQSGRPLFGRRISFAGVFALLVGISLVSNPASAADNSVPKMGDPDLTGGTRQIGVSWSHPQGVTGLEAYGLRYREKGDNEWQYADASQQNGQQNFEGQVTTATIPAFENYNMKDGTTYEVQIRAGKWNEGYSSWGEWSDITEKATLPAVTLTASEVTETTASLTLAHGPSNWYLQLSSPSTGTCIAVDSATKNISDLTGDTVYVWKAYSDANCANEIASETFSTVGLTADSITQTTATLKIANHSAAWWYQGNQSGATCTSVDANTATADLSGLDASTDYTYTAYDAVNCNAGDKIADVDFTTPEPITFEAGSITENRATLTLANHSGSWSHKRTTPTGGNCTAVTSGYTLSLSDLTAGQAYTYQAFSDSNCALGNKIGEESFTTIDFAFVSKTNTSATLKLKNYPSGQQWWYNETHKNAKSCTATTETEITVSGLTKNTSYTFYAYGKSSCLPKDAIGLVDLKTLPEHALFADNVAQTSATLRLTNANIAWWYQQTSPADSTCDSVAQGTTTKEISLSPSTSYTYQAFRTNCTETGKIDNISFTTLPAAAGKPTATVAGTTSVALSWTPDSTGGSVIDKWQYVKKEGSGNWETIWTDISGSGATTTSHTVTGLKSATAYQFKVRANNSGSGGGEGAASPESDSVTTDSYSLAAGSITHNTATLTISGHSGDWYYKEASGACSTDAVSGTSVDLDSLAGNTSHTYSAYSDNQCASENLLATAAAFLTKPAKPGKPVAAAGARSGTLVLTATLAGDDGALTKWEYTTDDGANWTDITRDTDNNLSDFVTGLTDGTNYTFKVRATNETGTGPVSEASDPVAPLDETLTASAVQHDTATLTIANYSTGSWYYKEENGACTTPETPALRSDGLSGLAGNTSHTYSAYSDDQCASENLLATAAAFLTKPAKPGKPAAAAGAGSGKLTLTATLTGGSGALTKWEYTKDDGATWTDITTDTDNNLSHVVSDLTDGTEYTFKVRATNATGTGPASDASTAVAPLDEALTAGSVTHNTATLTIANHPGNWYYKEASGTCSTDAVSTTSVDLDGLAGNTSYTYSAYSDSGCTSSKLLATASAFLTKPAKPGKPTATAGAGSGKLTLAATLTGGTGALTKWEYTKDDGANWTDITTDTDNSLSHVVTDLTDGTEYTFKVRATNATGTGPVSDASTAVAPADEALTAGSITHNTATLTLANHPGNWWLKRTVPASTNCKSKGTTATESLSSLAGNTSYAYKAYSNSDCSTEIAAHTFLTKPAKPGKPAAAAGAGSGKLTLTATLTGGSGALTKWEYTKDDGANWTDITTDTDNNLSHVVSDLTDGTSYTFKVRATNATGTGPASDASTAVAPADETLTAGSVTHNSAKLTIANYPDSWYYKANAAPHASCSGSAVSGKSTNLSGLSGNKKYIYKAYSDSGCQTELAAASEFLTEPGKPAKPTAVSGAGSGKLTLSSSVTGDGTLDKWQYTRNNGAIWTDVLVTSTSLSHVVSNLTDGTSYTFKVRAVNATGTSADSDASDAATPAEETLQATEVTHNSAKLTIANFSGDWYYKQTNSANSSCSNSAVSTPSLDLANLASNTTHIFKAYNDNGCSSALATATFLTKPGKPAKPTATANVGSAKLKLASSVTGNSALTKWQYTRDNGANWTDIDVTSTSLSHLLSSGLSNGTSYTFKVRAVNATGASEDSDASDAATPTEPNLAASSVEAATATLTIGNWSGDWRYKYTSPNGGQCSSAQSGTTADLTDLKTNTNYTFNAYSDGSCSTSAAIATATLLTKPGKPATPTATPGAGSGKLTLASSVTGSGTLTKWRYSQDNGATWKDIGVTAKTLSHVVPNLVDGVDYTFKVRAVNATGEGAASDASAAAQPASETLTASGITASGAMLTMANYSGDWWYKQTSPSDGACQTPSTATTATVSGLTASTRHTFQSYSDSNCSESLAGVATFKTLNATDGFGDGTPSGPELSVTAITAAAARLTIANHSGEWWHKLSGGVCSGPHANNAAVELAGLAGARSYTVAAYGDSECATELDTATFATLGLVLSLHSTELLEGTATNWTAKLFTRPSGPVTVALSMTGDAGGLTLDTGARAADGSAELRFTTGNWNQPATVTVAAVEDANGVGERAVIAHAASGGGYGGVTTELAVNVVDNDTVGLAFAPERISLAAGASATYTLRLTASPAEAVSVSISSADAALSASPAVLEFAADEWPAEREVTVSAAPDAPTRAAALNHRAAGGEYEGVEAALEVRIAADLHPAFAADAAIADQEYIQGIEVAPLALPAASGGDGELRYALSPALPAGLTFDPATRTVEGTPVEAAPAAVFTYTATDSDAVDPDSASLSFRIEVVADLAPDFAGAAVADQKLTQNLAMTPFTLPAATGGDGELRYALSPALPAGLTFDPATRTVEGTPAEAAPAAVYTYTATDSDAVDPDSASLSFSLAVAADLVPDFAGAAVADQKLTQNLAMTPLTLPAATGGDGELRYALSPALPAGLTFDPATRTLSGAPVAAAPAAVYTYTATDSDAVDPDSASLSFSIEVSILEAEKKMLEDALSAQGRALLAGATGVIGERFRAPASARAEAAEDEEEQDRAEAMLNAFAGWLAGTGGGRGGYGSYPAAGGTPGFGSTGGQFSAPRGAFGTGAEASGDNLGSTGAPPPAAGFGAGAFGFENAFAGRSFALPLNAAAVSAANPSLARWTLWGAADSQRFDGASEGGAYNGGVDSLWLGADTRLGNGVLVGAAVSRSRGETYYDIGGRRGGLETALTSVLPYIRGETASGLELWALGGVGGGGAEHFSGPAGAPVDTADLDMNMAAAGLRQPLAQRGAAQFSLVASGGYVWLRTDGDGNRRAVDGLDVSISQARLAIEVAGTGGPLSPYLRLGARGDGGDGQTGGGLEMVGGLRYAGARFDFEAQARWLTAHSTENYEEFGGMARLTVKSREDGSGPRLTFAPTWGGVGETLFGGGSGTNGGMMFGGPDIAALAGRGPAVGAGAMALESDLGWGFAFDRGLLTLGATHSRMGLGERETVGFSWESANGEPGIGLGQGLKLRFGYELPTTLLEGGPRLELNYTARF